MECERVESIIVGAGMSGICMAVKLLQAGRKSLVLLEASGHVGGVWSGNAYPGCRCDVPSHLYSFSFSLNPSWTHFFSDRLQIHRYIQEAAARHGLLPHLRLHTEVVSAVWQDSDSMWHVDAVRKHENGIKGERPVQAASTSSSLPLKFEARFLIRAVGALGVPSFPHSDIGSFEGTWFHSSQWPADQGLEIVRDRVVAVVGTGASSIQIVPEVAKVAKRVYVCQRTPPWILPNRGGIAIPCCIRRLLACFPLLLSLLWWVLFLFHEFVYGPAFWGGAARPLVAAVAKFSAKRHIRRSISDPALRSAVLPSYDLGCKRVLSSDSFYRCLTLEHVELVQGSLAQVLPHSIVVDQQQQQQRRRIDADVIVYATGFDIWTPHFPIVGRDNLHLSSCNSAFLGITARRFPNFFMLVGPNTGVGHTSQLVMIEAQARYILSCIHLLRPPARSMELRASTQKQFDHLIATRFPNTIWHRCGCDSWYIDPSTRKVGAIWPSSTLEYMYRTRFARPQDYHIA